MAKFDQMLRKRFISCLPFFFVLPLLLAWWAYAPGLHGGFLFDDFANLPALGESGPINTWPTFWRYITSGIADPTGRPLTLLTFLIDARDWPAAPYAFKRTNLILHLLNSVMLYALLSRLGRSLGFGATQYRLAAVIGASLWVLHPLLVSTTLYVVQREAMLPATFALAGLLLWIYGRSQLAAGKARSGWLWSILGLGGFTLLGVFAKANGMLLPIYALLIELVVLAPRQHVSAGATSRNYRIFLLFFAWLPAAVVCLYLLWVGVHGIITGGPALRPWTYSQRLLTEPRVLLDYLWQLWVPRSSSSGLFNDQYKASTSLLNPITTLPAIVMVTAMITAAFKLRRRLPAVSLAILFFFAGQLLESTSIPLELYFEHRNYLPALLMFWPLGLWLTDKSSLSWLKVAMIAALPLGLALMTHSKAEVWGSEDAQAIIWAQINPESPRAQANAAQIDMQKGHPEQAADRLQKLLDTQPNQTQLAFNLIGARCMLGGIESNDIAAARVAMLTTPNTGALFVHWFDRVLPVAVSGSCHGLTPSVLVDLIDAGLHNPKLNEPGPKQDLTYLRGRVALAQHQPDIALADFMQALDFQVRPDIALTAAAALGAAGHASQGLQLLDHYQQEQSREDAPGAGMPMLHAWVLTHQHYWPQELQRLRAQLTLDAAANSHNTVRPAAVQYTSH